MLLLSIISTSPVTAVDKSQLVDESTRLTSFAHTHAHLPLTHAHFRSVPWGQQCKRGVANEYTKENILIAARRQRRTIAQCAGDDAWLAAEWQYQYPLT